MQMRVYACVPIHILAIHMVAFACCDSADSTADAVAEPNSHTGEWEEENVVKKCASMWCKPYPLHELWGVFFLVLEYGSTEGSAVNVKLCGGNVTLCSEFYACTVPSPTHCANIYNCLFSHIYDSLRWNHVACGRWRHFSSSSFYFWKYIIICLIDSTECMQRLVR